MTITRVEAFASPSDCWALAIYLSANVQRLGRTNIEPFFNHRQISLSAVDDDGARQTIIDLRRRIASTVSTNDRDLWPDYTDLVLWREGMEMAPHVDNGPPHFEHRQFSSILYLSSCEGGQTFFPELGDESQVVPGDLIIFPSGERHGVRPVGKGFRSTLATWFTDDKSKWEKPTP